VQVRRAPHHQRVQDVALDGLHDEHGQHHEKRGHDTVAHQGDEGRHRAGGEGTHVGDEGGDEGQDGQRDDQRHPDDGQGHADEDRVEGGHEADAAHVLAQRRPRGLPHTLCGRLAALAEEPGHPGPDQRPVLDEEEEQHEHDGDAHEHLADQQSAAEHARGDRVQAVGQALLGLADGLLGVDLAEPQRALQQVAQLADAGLHGGHEICELIDDRGHDEVDRAREQAHAAQEDQDGGQQVGHPPAAQPLGQRVQQGAEQDRDDQREYDQADLPQDEADERDGQDDHEQAPAQVRHPDEPAGPPRRGVHQMGWSIEAPQALHSNVAWEDIRTIVECSPQFAHTEVSSKRCRQ